MLCLLSQPGVPILGLFAQSLFFQNKNGIIEQLLLFSHLTRREHLPRSAYMVMADIIIWIVKRENRGSETEGTWPRSHS